MGGRRICVTTLLSIGVAAMAFTDALASTVVLKTFNVRNSLQSSWSSPFPGPTPQRRERVVASIILNAPGVVGLQEVTPEQWGDISADLSPTYDGYSQERDDSGTGEASSILWLRDRYTAFDTGSFYLNLTPGISAPHPLEQADEPPRIASYVGLIDNESGSRFYVANTHMSTSSTVRQGDDVADLNSEVRERIAALDLLPDFAKFDGGGWLDNDRIPGGAEILAATLQEIAGDLPFFLTGDFNEGPGRFTHDLLTGEQTSGYVDGFSVLDSLAENVGGVDTILEIGEFATFNRQTSTLENGRSYTEAPVSEGVPIDYVFASMEWNVLSSAIERPRFDMSFPALSGVSCAPCWTYASDHYAVTSTFELADTPQVPLPPSAAMMALGLAGICAFARSSLMLQRRRRG